MGGCTCDWRGSCYNYSSQLVIRKKQISEISNRVYGTPTLSARRRHCEIRKRVRVLSVEASRGSSLAEFASGCGVAELWCMRIFSGPATAVRALELGEPHRAEQQTLKPGPALSCRVVCKPPTTQGCRSPATASEKVLNARHLRRITHNA